MSETSKGAWYALEKLSFRILEISDEDVRRVWPQGPPDGWSQDRDKAVKAKNQILREMIEDAESDASNSSQRAENLRKMLETPAIPENITIPMELWGEVVGVMSWAQQIAHNGSMAEKFDEIQALFEKLTEATKGIPDGNPTKR